MVHPTEVEKYKGSLKELAEDLAYLRYDKQSEFLKEYAKYIRGQAK